MSHIAIIGPETSGKHTLLQAFLLLCQNYQQYQQWQEFEFYDNDKFRTKIEIKSETSLMYRDQLSIRRILKSPTRIQPFEHHISINSYFAGSLASAVSRNISEEARYIEKADGIIITLPLFDMNRVKLDEKRLQTFFQVLNTLLENHNKFIALIITKVDMFPKLDVWDINSIITQLFGENIIHELHKFKHKYGENFKLFTSSSIQPSEMKDRPLGVLEPFLWLMENIERRELEHRYKPKNFLDQITTFIYNPKSKYYPPFSNIDLRQHNLSYTPINSIENYLRVYSSQKPFGIVSKEHYLVDNLNLQHLSNLDWRQPETYYQGFFSVLNKDIPISRSLDNNMKEVKFSSYVPFEVNISQRYSIFIYAYTSVNKIYIENDIEKFKEELGSVIPKSKTAKQINYLELSSKITVIPECDEVEFEPESLTKKWHGDWSRFEFEFRPSSDLMDETLFVRISIQVEGIEIAHIKSATHIQRVQSRKMRIYKRS